jgi:hypothetical protein
MQNQRNIKKFVSTFNNSGIYLKLINRLHMNYILNGDEINNKTKDSIIIYIMLK